MGIFDWVVVVIHVVVCLVLIALILMHSGRGGGLSDMFGGAQFGGAMAGATIVERNLDRVTIVCGVIFGFTSITLGLRLG